MKICICGGGNLGHVVAGFVSSQGKYDVCLLTRHPELWSQELTIEAPEGTIYSGHLNGVYSDARQAVADADIVLFCLPGYAIRDTLLQIKDYLRADAAVGTVVSSTGFFFQAFDVLSQEQTLFGFQRVPFISRVVEYGSRARLMGYKDSLELAIERGKTSRESLKETLQNMLRTPIHLLGDIDIVVGYLREVGFPGFICNDGLSGAVRIIDPKVETETGPVTPRSGFIVPYGHCLVVIPSVPHQNSDGVDALAQQGRDVVGQIKDTAVKAGECRFQTVIANLLPVDGNLTESGSSNVNRGAGYVSTDLEILPKGSGRTQFKVLRIIDPPSLPVAHLAGIEPSDWTVQKTSVVRVNADTPPIAGTGLQFLTGIGNHHGRGLAGEPFTFHTGNSDRIGSDKHGPSRLGFDPIREHP